MTEKKSLSEEIKENMARSERVSPVTAHISRLKYFARGDDYTHVLDVMEFRIKQRMAARAQKHADDLTAALDTLSDDDQAYAERLLVKLIRNARAAGRS